MAVDNIRPSNAEIAIGIVCACLPALSALVTHIYHEYSTNGATHGSEPSRGRGRQHGEGRASRTEPVKPPLGLIGIDCDQDILMQNFQRHSRIETTVLGDEDQYQLEAGGILKTVDVSTSVSSQGG